MILPVMTDASRGSSPRRLITDVTERRSTGRSGLHMHQVPPPMPGCWFVGTECRVFYQTCKYCCGGGASYSKPCGWCIGWYDAPPCR